MITFKNEKDHQEILEALELNMNEEFRATLQYICHRILAQEQNPVLAESFKSAALDEMAHILFFSDLITRYGGKPKFIRWEVDQSSDIKEMIKNDITLEKAAKQRYALQLEGFKDYTDFSTILRSVLSDEEDHEEKFTTYLKETLSSLI
jgi:bacterioferritin (cytochrome b1)